MVLGTFLFVLMLAECLMLNDFEASDMISSRPFFIRCSVGCFKEMTPPRPSWSRHWPSTRCIPCPETCWSLGWKRCGWRNWRLLMPLDNCWVSESLLWNFDEKTQSSGWKRLYFLWLQKLNVCSLQPRALSNMTIILQPSEDLQSSIQTTQPAPEQIQCWQAAGCVPKRQKDPDGLLRYVDLNLPGFEAVGTTNIAPGGLD